MSWTRKLIAEVSHVLRGGAMAARPWGRAATKIQAFATSPPARIIGITADRRGAGVSLLARELAAAYAAKGDAALLIDASRAAPDRGQTSAAIDLTIEAGEPAHLLSTATISTIPLQQRFDENAFATALEKAAAHFDAIIVDLPPVSIAGEPVPTFKSLASACDLILLVSVTGTVSRAEFADCLAACKIAGIEIGGVILNDWKITAGELLASS